MNEQNTALQVSSPRHTNIIPINGIEDLKTLGAIFAASEMFGTSNPAQSIVIAAMCHQDGISYSKWQENNHMIHGKKSKRSDAIHADFLRNGGKVKILKRDSDAVIIHMIDKHGYEYDFSLTWGDALKEPFVYLGKESDVLDALESGNTTKLKLKDKYRSPRSRTQMLWARVISDSVRAVDPTCVQGVYTPEEVEDFIEADTAPTAKPRTLDPQEVQKRVESVKEEVKATEPTPATKKTATEIADAEVVETVIVDNREAVRKAAQEKIAEQKAIATEKPVEVAPTTPPAPKPAPAPRQTVAKVEPTPFDTPAEAAPAVDNSICQIAGKLFGVPWASMDVPILKYALEKLSDQLSDDAKFVVAGEIAKKQVEEQD